MADSRPEILLALDEALDWLEQIKPELHQIVSHHFFTGLTVEEISGLLEASSRTVKRRLSEGRILLHGKILELIDSPQRPPP